MEIYNFKWEEPKRPVPMPITFFYPNDAIFEENDLERIQNSGKISYDLIWVVQPDGSLKNLMTNEEEKEVRKLYYKAWTFFSEKL